jgi:hypothetical protein
VSPVGDGAEPTADVPAVHENGVIQIDHVVVITPGDVIVELFGPAKPAGDGPATFWDLAYTVADLDATVRRLGGAVGLARAAVQPGRRIASLRRGVLAVPTAFMSPDPGPRLDGRPAGGR